MAKKTTKPEEPEQPREPIVTHENGWPRYACPVCGRDSDSESTIRDHIQGHYPTWLGDPIAVEESTDGAAATDQDGVQRAVPDGGEPAG